MAATAGEALTATAVETIARSGGLVAGRQVAIAPPYREHPTTSQTPRIDQIVPPGFTINIADNMWSIGTPALGAGFRRR